MDLNNIDISIVNDKECRSLICTFCDSRIYLKLSTKFTQVGDIKLEPYTITVSSVAASESKYVDAAVRKSTATIAQKMLLNYKDDLNKIREVKIKDNDDSVTLFWQFFVDITIVNSGAFIPLILSIGLFSLFSEFYLPKLKIEEGVVYEDIEELNRYDEKTIVRYNQLNRFLKIVNFPFVFENDEIRLETTTDLQRRGIIEAYNGVFVIPPNAQNIADKFLRVYQSFLGTLTDKAFRSNGIKFII